MSVTIKEFVLKKYNEFLYEMKPIIDDIKIFPDIEDIDVVDLLALVEVIFPDHSKTKESLQGVLKMKDLKFNDETVDKITLVLNKFLLVIEKIKNM